MEATCAKLPHGQVADLELFIMRFLLTAMSTAVAPPSLDDLLARAALVRAGRGLGAAPPAWPSDALAFASEYVSSEVSGPRGFCNWLVPGALMLGQYPGESPIHGPSAAEARAHVARCAADARVGTWVCLQTEVPAQDDDAAWRAALADGGGVRLAPPLRERFPGIFSRYAPLAAAGAPPTAPPPDFLRAPIEDLSTPDTSALRALLGDLLGALDARAEEAIYMHCWGGRGRAGLVGACLLSLMWPRAEADEILGLVQAAYDTRAGAALMPAPLQQSPQTEGQRRFVREFVSAVRETASSKSKD